MKKIQQSLFFASTAVFFAALSACTIAPDDGNQSLTSVDPLKAINGELEYRREATTLDPKPGTTAPAVTDNSGVTSIKDAPPPTSEEQDQLSQLKGKIKIDAEIAISLDHLQLMKFADAVDKKDAEVCAYQVSKLTLPGPQDPDMIDKLIQQAFVPEAQKKDAAVVAAKKQEILGLKEGQTYDVELTMADPTTGKVTGTVKVGDGKLELPLRDTSFVRKNGTKYSLYLEFIQADAAPEAFPAFVTNLQHEPINDEHKKPEYDRHLLKKGRKFDQIHVLNGTLEGNAFTGKFELYALNKDPGVLNDMINCYFTTGGRLGDSTPEVKAEWSSAPATSTTTPKNQPASTTGANSGTTQGVTGSIPPSSKPTNPDEVDDGTSSVADAAPGTGEAALAELDTVADITTAPEFVYTDDRSRGFTIDQIENQCEDGEVKIEIAKIPMKVHPSDYIPKDDFNLRRNKIRKRFTEINDSFGAGLFVNAMDYLFDNPKKIYFQLRGCYSKDPQKPSLVFFHTSSRLAKFNMNDPDAIWQKFPQNLTRFVNVGGGKIAFRGNIPRRLTPDEVEHIICIKNDMFCNGVKEKMGDREEWPRSVTQFLAYLIVDQKTQVASTLQRLPRGRRFKKSRFIHVSTQFPTVIETDWDEKGREFVVKGSREEYMVVPEDQRLSLVGSLDVLEFQMEI